MLKMWMEVLWSPRVVLRCTLLAGLLCLVLLCSSDLLQVMAASQDVLAARAARGSAVRHLGLVALGQGLQQLVLLLFQLLIASSVHMRFEAQIKAPRGLECIL